MSNGPKLTALGKFVVLLVILGSAFGAYLLFSANPPGLGSMPPPDTKADPRHSVAPPSPYPGGGTGGGPTTNVAAEISIAYGTEKRRWLESAVKQFAATPEGQAIKINLIPKGSLEGGLALTNEKENKRIHVWAPASSVYKENVVREFQAKYNSDAFVEERSLALTPMVFVIWDERYKAFSGKYPALTFTTVAEAVAPTVTWDVIAKQPDWGVFKFAHTHPNQSNSGLVTLLLMAYDFHKKNKGLAVKDITPEFQMWMQGLERGVSGLENSTGVLMENMVLRGPSTYDAVYVYESVAIDNLKYAEGRWGTLKVVYPKYNMWNDNPYLIVNGPWVSPEQKAAAKAFLEFLLSDPMQNLALEHGFRPASVSVSVTHEGSPFTKYKKYGLQIDLSTMCEYPAPEVISNLLQAWQRLQIR